MKQFNNEEFLLDTKTASRLYHEYAEHSPIIDYHCHISPELIAKDHCFSNLSEVWLHGDHYKWRAMRANGIIEDYITGKRSDYEKFEKWAECVPHTMRNPLYHWTHLELKTAFNIDKLLNTTSCKEIYDQCTEMLQTSGYTARGLMRKYKVEVICTTDDPIDTLDYHALCKQDNFSIKVLPTWRPDKVMAIDSPVTYRDYITKLCSVSNIDIKTYDDLLEALQCRHTFFDEHGCRLSDHGLDVFYAEDYKHSDICTIFNRTLQGQTPTAEEVRKFKSAILIELAKMDHNKGWVQQFHYGALRNNNSRMYSTIGADTGFDSIGDRTTANNMSKFLNRLDTEDKLAKTIIYNLNPRDNDMVATMIGNFQDGRYGAGKIQFGSGWWFLDQKYGIENQLNTLSVMGLLSRFVGMLTDSRSFLSYSRHEYFRRILCNLIGNDIEKGLLPASELEFIGKSIVQAVSYNNAKEYFNF